MDLICIGFNQPKFLKKIKVTQNRFSWCRLNGLILNLNANKSRFSRFSGVKAVQKTKQNSKLIGCCLIDLFVASQLLK